MVGGGHVDGAHFLEELFSNGIPRRIVERIRGMSAQRRRRRYTLPNIEQLSMDSSRCVWVFVSLWMPRVECRCADSHVPDNVAAILSCWCCAGRDQGRPPPRHQPPNLVPISRCRTHWRGTTKLCMFMCDSCTLHGHFVIARDINICNTTQKKTVGTYLDLLPLNKQFSNVS